MDELAIALRHRPDRAARPQRAGRSIRTPGNRSRSRNLVGCLREGAERFGWADRDPDAGRSPRRPLAGRHRRRVLDLPGSTRALDGDARVARPTARSRSRSPRPTSAPAPAPCSPRSPPTRSGADPDAGPRRDRRQPLAAGAASPAARWARRPGARRSCKACRQLREQPAATEVTADTSDEIGPRAAAALAARVRRAVRRGARRRRHRRDPRAPACSASSPCGRILNPKTAPLAVHRRHDDGHLDGAARGERHRPRVRRLPQPRPRQYHVPRARGHPGRSTRSGSTRTTRSSTRWARRASARSASSAPPRRSPTPSTTRPACACATCRFARTSWSGVLRARSS